MSIYGFWLMTTICVFRLLRFATNILGLLNGFYLLNVINHVKIKIYHSTISKKMFAEIRN